MANPNEWSGAQHPLDPDNYWLDDDTEEVVCAWCARRADTLGEVKHDRSCGNPNKGKA
jgi:hypothetical protein